MKEKYKNSVGITLFLFFTILFYLTVSFISLNINPIEWTEIERAIFAICEFYLITRAMQYFTD